MRTPGCARSWLAWTWPRAARSGSLRQPILQQLRLRAGPHHRWPTARRSRSMRRPGGSLAFAAAPTYRCLPPTDDRVPAWRGVMVGPLFPELLVAAQGGDERAFAVLWRGPQPARPRLFPGG